MLYPSLYRSQLSFSKPFFLTLFFSVFYSCHRSHGKEEEKELTPRVRMDTMEEKQLPIVSFIVFMNSLFDV